MTAIEIINGRPESGGYKVDASRGGHNGRVSSEWFSRPDDEKYLSLSELYASVKGRAARSQTRTVKSAAIRVEAHRDDPEKLAFILPDADAPVAPTHWSFGQLASLVGAPAAYLRQLPAPLAGINLQYGLTNHRAQQGAFEGTDPAVPEIALILVLKADMLFKWNVGDGFSEECTTRDGNISLVPAQTEAEFHCRGEHEILDVILPSAQVSALLDEHGQGALSSFDPLTSATLFRDEILRRTMMQIWHESARSGATNDLLMDGLTQVLIARLLDKAGALRCPQVILPLSQDELSRLDAIIDDRLDDRLTVEDLATTLDMPRWTFSDAFKATTVDTPYAYVTSKRIDKACDLLRLGDMPLAEIAYACGFSSQAHMTTVFGQKLGITPGRYRQEARR
ncbi:MAG: AraC family transcriptional regulator [Rhodospirillaceae bacterium]|nr:AraC family transcriptional regulator [Rhodospirillaceae bacterium]